MPKGKYIRKPRAAIFPVGPSIAYIPLTRGLYARVDWDDATWLQNRSWTAHWSAGTETFYADCHVDEFGVRRTVSMHSAILGINGRVITADHINAGETLDNRRANLRRSTRSQQRINRRIFDNNKSGFRGVSFHKRTGKWQANIQIAGEFIYLGIHKTPELAHVAYCEASVKYHGDFARIA